MFSAATTPPGPTPAPAPIGRDDEVAAISRVLAELEAAPLPLAIVGEAGIGKTHLLDHLDGAARSLGAAVRRGRASEFERDAPFSPLAEALEGLAHGLEVGAVAEHRHAVHRRIRTLLREQAQQQPFVLVIDDLHWADAATVDLVTSLIDRPPGPGFLLVIAFRPHQAASALTPALTRAADARRIHQIALGPLSVEAAASLVGGTPSHDELAAIHHACGGNPFHLQRIRRGAGTGSVAPAPTDPIIALLASELAPLPPESRRLLEAAAVAGDPFEIGLVARVCGLASPAALAELDRLLATDFVRSTATPRWFQFRHPLVRQTVYEAMPAGRRLATHARAAEILRADGAGATALAHHVEQSAAPGDPDAIATLHDAGMQAFARSPRIAARWLGAAWTLVPEAAHAEPQHVELLYAFGLALTVSGGAERAAALDSATLAGLPTGDPVRLRFELGRATVAEVLGRFTEARARLHALLDDVGVPPTGEALGICLTLAVLECELGQAGASLAQVEQALRIAGELGYPPIRGMVLTIAAGAHLLAGDVPAAEVAADEAAAVVEAIADAAQELTPSVLGALGESELFPMLLAALVQAEVGLGRHAAAARHATHGLVVTRKGTWPVRATLFLAVLSGCALAEGRLHEALDCADGAAEEAAMLDYHGATSWSHRARCAALEAIDADAAIDAGEIAVAAAREYRLPGTLTHAGQALARALLAAGLPRRAADTILSTHGGDCLATASPETHPLALRLLAEAEIGAGNLDAAGGWVEACRAPASVGGLLLGAVHADAADAALALAAGDAVTAAALAERGAAAARSAGATLEAERLGILHGRALGEIDRDAAATILRRAEAGCAGMGARRLQAEATRELRRLGLRVTRSGRGAMPASAPGRPMADAEPLTTRQREIAALAAAGRSNRAIAEQLFLSTKTVETHLSSVYVKLGVSSRRELAGRLDGE